MTRLALLALVLLAPAPGCTQQAAVQLAIRDVTVIPMTGAPLFRFQAIARIE